MYSCNVTSNIYCKISNPKSDTQVSGLGPGSKVGLGFGPKSRARVSGSGSGLTFRARVSSSGQARYPGNTGMSFVKICLFFDKHG